MDERLRMVDEFHKAFRLTRGDVPSLPRPTDTDEAMSLLIYVNFMRELSVSLRAAATEHKSSRLLRLHLLQEELSELAESLYSNNEVGVLDALCDLSYVLDGSTLTLGMQHVFLTALREVHRSNMSKLVDGEPLTEPSGRVLKGPNYSPPDLRPILESGRAESLKTRFEPLIAGCPKVME